MSIMKTCKVGKVVTMAKLNANVSAVERNSAFSDVGSEMVKQVTSAVLVANEKVGDAVLRYYLTINAKNAARNFNDEKAILEHVNFVPGNAWQIGVGGRCVEAHIRNGKAESLIGRTLRGRQSVMPSQRSVFVDSVARLLIFMDIIYMVTSQIKRLLKYFVSIAMPEGIEA
jgi:hypothetical protein